MYCHNPECKIALNNELVDVNGWRKLLSLMVAEMGSDWSCYCKMQTLRSSRSITQQLMVYRSFEAVGHVQRVHNGGNITLYCRETCLLSVITGQIVFMVLP